MLKNLPVPLISEEQIHLFTKKSIHAQKAGSFDISEVKQKLRVSKHEVLAIDIGGDKIVANTYTARDGTLHATGTEQKASGEKNAGYIQLLESLAKNNTVPVGISVAGPVDGTRALGSPETQYYIETLNKKYNGDFAHLFSTTPLSVSNDALGGLRAATLQAHTMFPHIRHVIYAINGSGINGTLWTENTLYSAESGHIRVVDELNPFHRTSSCNVFGNSYTCLEKIAGGKAGIAATWETIHRKKTDGKTLSEAYQHHNRMAEDLYNTSTIGFVHMILGIVHVFSLEHDLSRLAVVCDGGVFRVPDYFERVQYLFETYTGETSNFLKATEAIQNASLDGAAISALSI